MPYKLITDPNKITAAQSVMPTDPKEMINPAEDERKLREARQNYIRMTREAQNAIDKTTYGTTGWRAAAANMPVVKYLTEGMAPGETRRSIAALKTNYGIEKLQQNPKMFSPLTEQEFERVASTIGGLNPYAGEEAIDTGVATFQDILTEKYAEELRKYRTRYGKLPEGFNMPTQNYPTIKSLPGFQPRPQKRK